MPKRSKRSKTNTDTARLHALNLNVTAVTGDTVHWASHPTEAEQAFAAETLGRRVRHEV